MRSLPAFANEPVVDFSKPANREAMEKALRDVRAQLGREYELLIAGQRHKTSEKLKSLNPSRPSEVVGIHNKATADLAREAVESAYDYFPQWSAVPAETRAETLLRAVALIRKRKFEFDAWLVYEAGKTWPEAEADVCEAIDFCEYYARQMVRLAKPDPLLQLPGEKDELFYLPLGVGVIIPPWNFPLAIMVGMTTAALVAGNTVVIKPSSDTPTIAAKFAEVLLDAGFPPQALSLLVGSGSVVGDVIVAHPKTRFIAFTGSRDVGLHINELAAKPQKGQIWIKRVLAEMGGKDAIVVDREADLNSAVKGVLWSAFGYQGQKCSACSRAIVDEAVYDQFLEKLKAEVANLKVGPSDEPDNYMGPVINEGAQRSILDYVEIGKKEGRVIAGGSTGARRRLLRSTDRDRRCGFQIARFSGRDFRSGAGGGEGSGFRSRARAGQRFRIRADGCGFHQEPGEDSEGSSAVFRGQSLYQPQVHRRHGGRASFRRIQYVGNGFQGGRSGLLAAVPASQGHRREGLSRQVC